MDYKDLKNLDKTLELCSLLMLSHAFTVRYAKFIVIYCI